MIATAAERVESGVVLIVEDDVATAELQRRAIQGAGFAVRLASRVAEAIRMIADDSVALALVDYRLPDGDALAVLDAARSALPSVPVIVVTGLGDERVAAEVIHRGAADYIIKRGDFWEDLPRTVGRVLQLAAAERANSRLASIVGCSDDAILSTTKDGRITSWNLGAERSFGYSAREAEVEHIERYFTPDRRGDVPELLLRVQRGETVRQHDATWLAKDGSTRHVSLTMSPIRDRADSVAGVSVILRDISERRKAEIDRVETAAALHKSEEQFRQIAETIDEVFWMTDAKSGAMLYISPAYDRIWGRSRDELYVRPEAWLDAVHEEDRGRLASRLRRGATSEPMEPYRVVRPDGGIRWIRAREFVIRRADGEIYRTTGIASDITDLKAAEEASNEKARLAALAADVGIVQTQGDKMAEILQRSVEFMVRHLDAAFARIWTLNAQQDTLELQASAGMYTHLDGAHSRVPVGKLKIGRIAQERKPHLTNDVLHDPWIGDPEWARRESMVAFAGYPLMVGDDIVGVMAMFARRPLGQFTLDGLRTVADTIALGIRRKQAEKTQSGLEDQLRQAQKMEAIGQLAGGVAHDFNNLLSVILGYGNLLQSSPGHSDADRKGLEQICKAAERAGGLTRQLLAFSRKQVLVPEVFDLRDSVQDIAKMLGRLIGEDVELSLSFAREACRVRADRGQIDQVIANLAVNSRDAMPQGGKLTIEVRHADFTEAMVHDRARIEPGPYVLLAVTDTGVGMNAETRSHAFEPFFTTKGPGEGTGLGLATVYGIVKQSDGFIWLYSEPGQGTTFKIYLPRTESEAGAVVPVQGGSLPGGSETILLVEDDEALRGLAQLILEERGYRVLAASGGEEAERLAAGWEGPIHLLLSDVIMPGMNGREVADRLCPRRPEMRTIFMSGYTGDAVLRRGIVAEDADFIQKPFTPTILAVKVRQVLDRQGVS